MTAGKSVNARVGGRLGGRKHAEVRRHTRRLAPGVVGICLVMVFAAVAFVVVPSTVRASNVGQSSGLSAADNGTGPDLIQGTYLTLQCTHGTISLGGTVYCSHTTVGPRDMCDSSSCQFSMTGTVDSGYTFYGWVLSGQASVGCGSCLSTTLTLYTPNPNNQYSASVTLDTTSSPPPPPPPTVEVTFVTFENWSMKWIPAEVQVCPTSGGSCSTVSNGQTLPLKQYTAYTLDAIDLPYLVAFSQWTTNAGILSPSSANPTQFTPTNGGVVSLIANITSRNWAGYIYSQPLFPSGPAPASNCFGGGTCSGASGDGQGTTCVISSFSEITGDFLYVTVNYLGGTNVISSVTAGSVSASYIGGEFANSQSVAFYDVVSEHGGTVTITVTISIAEYGTCRVGQLTAGTTVGVVGTGANNYGASLSVTNIATHQPSLLLALIGSTRPSGAYTMASPAGNWVVGANQATGTNPGTESALYGYNDSASGTVTFAFTCNPYSGVYISGIVVELYLPNSVGISNVTGVFRIPMGSNLIFGMWVGIGGLPLKGPNNNTNLWQAGVKDVAGSISAWVEDVPGNITYNNSFQIFPGDQIEVTVRSSGGTSFFSIQDQSRLGNPTWSRSTPFTPSFESGEWIAEPTGATGTTHNNTNVTYMAVNGVALTMYAAYTGLWYSPRTGAAWYFTPLVAGLSSPEFSIEPT